MMGNVSHVVRLDSVERFMGPRWLGLLHAYSPLLEADVVLGDGVAERVVFTSKTLAMRVPHGGDLEGSIKTFGIVADNLIERGWWGIAKLAPALMLPLAGGDSMLTAHGFSALDVESLNRLVGFPMFVQEGGLGCVWGTDEIAELLRCDVAGNTG